MENKIRTATEQLLNSYLSFTGKSASGVHPEDYILFRKEALAELDAGYEEEDKNISKETGRTEKEPAYQKNAEYTDCKEEVKKTTSFVEEESRTAKITDVADMAQVQESQNAMKELMMLVKG